MAKVAPFPIGDFLCLWFYLSSSFHIFSTKHDQYAFFCCPLCLTELNSSFCLALLLAHFLLCWLMGSSKGVTSYENKQDQSPCKCSISGLPRTGAYFLHWLFPGCFHLQLQALDLSWQCQAWREQQWMYFSVCKDVLPGRDPEIPSLGAE